MFFTQLESLKYEHHAAGLSPREKEGLDELLRPLRCEEARVYTSIREILDDVAAGTLTPLEGENAIGQLRNRQSGPAVSTLELTAESLGAFAANLERSCCSLERSMERWSRDMESSVHRLEQCLENGLYRTGRN